MPIKDELHAHLSQFVTAPFLFVGSGLSRRYVNSDTWAGLLERFATQMGKPYARYHSAAGGDYPAIATALAQDFHDHWWDDPRYEGSRTAHPNPQKISSPLKIEISAYVSGLLGNLPDKGPLREEIELLKKAVVQGVITTNYDPMLEDFFDLAVFTGQEELLFSDPLGVGEIYKIHGSYENPESLVLTSEDYDVFKERNTYLAAKLLTLFVEHPIIFLGYSLTDSNVQDILLSISKILTKENISKLQDRLIFVQWDPIATSPAMVQSVIPVGGLSIPIWQITVSDFREIFQALSQLKERIPLRLLRRIKDQITELVRTSDPKNKTYVTDLDDSVNTADVDVVVGVGLEKRLELHAQGIVGLNRHDLLRDIVEPRLDPGNSEAMELVVMRVLPKHLAGRTNTPIFKYLRACGYLGDDGTSMDDTLPAAVKARVNLGASFFKPGSSFKRRANELAKSIKDFQDFLTKSSMYEISLALSVMKHDDIDLPLLQIRLKHELASISDSTMPTELARAICIYDLVENQKRTIP